MIDTQPCARNHDKHSLKYTRVHSAIRDTTWENNCKGYWWRHEPHINTTDMNQPWLISALQEFFIFLQGPRDMTLILNFSRIINALNILFEITLFFEYHRTSHLYMTGVIAAEVGRRILNPCGTLTTLWPQNVSFCLKSTPHLHISLF